MCGTYCISLFFNISFSLLLPLDGFQFLLLLLRDSENDLFSKLRVFWSKLCKTNWISGWNLAYPVFISCIVFNMCENLHYESVYFKELHNDQEYYWPITHRAGAAVVSTITSKYYSLIHIFEEQNTCIKLVLKTEIL